MYVADEPFKDEDYSHTCDRVGCPLIAKFRLKVKLWAFGHDRASHAPAVMGSSLAVCDVHKESLKPEDVFGPRGSQGREVIAEAFVNAGKAVPDFDNAEIFCEPLNRKPN